MASTLGLTYRRKKENKLPIFLLYMFLQSDQREQRRVWPWVLLTFFVLFGILVAFAYAGLRSIRPEQFLRSALVQKYAGEERQGIMSIVPQLLGFTEPQTYLFLFLNNTEMRPSGGFIGTYATVRFDKGHPDILAVEGSEELDRRTPKEWKPVPPRAIIDYLGVSQWYFRDSNWSPDFVESTKTTRELYAKETGVAADDLDGVIGVTPTVLEEILRITGPITVQGITFTSENVTETLEYEVEYGYKDRGIPFETRKQIVGPFMEILLGEIKKHAFFDLQSFISRIKILADEKQILFSLDAPDVQEMLDAHDWTGRVASFDGDYLMWVDANLGALKTDHAMKRSLAYAIHKEESGRYIATAAMTYVNTGTFDWRTTRYRTYARVYVPKGAELISVDGSMDSDKSPKPGRIDQGEELRKQWFGTFISIEPKQTKTLTFTYVLPQSVAEKIDKQGYQLLVEKQSGIVSQGLTLRLNFGKTITGANPAEDEMHWGDEEYRIDTDLRVDRRFGVQLKIIN